MEESRRGGRDSSRLGQSSRLPRDPMRKSSLLIIASLSVLSCDLAAGGLSDIVHGKSAFSFRNVEYFHRWSANEQHEFTPENQEDLDHWTDMITINGYPDAHDGDALAEMANAVLENYKNHQAKVLKTNSVARTPEHPAEHFIAVLFAQPTFSEVAFARFRLIDGAGCSLVYSHRIYGENIGDQMSAWLKANGDAVEKSLM